MPRRRTGAEFRVWQREQEAEAKLEAARAKKLGVMLGLESHEHTYETELPFGDPRSFPGTEEHYRHQARKWFSKARRML